jgi:large subunit ribosomal protein L19
VSQELLNKAVADSMKQDVPQFEVGDTVKVHCRIIEGEKQRIQMFIGTVIARSNGGIAETFTVRRIVNNAGVERTFPIHSPKVADIEVVRRGKTRRAKLYYLRDRVGKATRIKEIRAPSKKERAAAEAAAKAKAESQAVEEAAPAEQVPVAAEE